MLGWVMVWALAQAQSPHAYIDRVNEVPDLTQTLIAFDIDKGGEAMCALATVSNSMMYLARHGFPELLADSDDGESSQIALAQRLAGPRFMNTRVGSGTSKEGILSGVRAYVEEHGYRVKTLAYEGIELHLRPNKEPRGRPPELGALKDALRGGGCIWLQVGWYAQKDGAFRKTGGHWVTLVGYGQDADGVEDESVLILHDPSPRAGKGFSNEFVRVEAISSGRILGWGLPQPATGFARVADGLSLPSDADTAILEGAIVLELSAP
jgi:hypothetical protein